MTMARQSQREGRCRVSKILVPNSSNPLVLDGSYSLFHCQPERFIANQPRPCETWEFGDAAATARCIGLRMS